MRPEHLQVKIKQEMSPGSNCHEVPDFILGRNMHNTDMIFVIFFSPPLM